MSLSPVDEAFVLLQHSKVSHGTHISFQVPINYSIQGAWNLLVFLWALLVNNFIKVSNPLKFHTQITASICQVCQKIKMDYKSKSRKAHESSIHAPYAQAGLIHPYQPPKDKRKRQEEKTMRKANLLSMYIIEGSFQPRVTCKVGKISQWIESLD